MFSFFSVRRTLDWEISIQKRDVGSASTASKTSRVLSCPVAEIFLPECGRWMANDPFFASHWLFCVACFVFQFINKFASAFVDVLQANGPHCYLNFSTILYFMMRLWSSAQFSHLCYQHYGADWPFIRIFFSPAGSSDSPTLHFPKQAFVICCHRLLRFTQGSPCSTGWMSE